MPHYAGNRFQNEIISILAVQIQKYILSAIKDAKYFSVILDCTPDMGHVEQITIILRYVHIQNDEVEVREDFVGFSPAQKSTGEAFYDFLIEKLSSLKWIKYGWKTYWIAETNFGQLSTSFVYAMQRAYIKFGRQ